MRKFTFTIALLATAVAAVGATYFVTASAQATHTDTGSAANQTITQPASGVENCSQVATENQAHTLLLRLFPNAKFLSAEPLSSSVTKTSCLLEVEMIADINNPGTKGFVYVLPDGERFLNGPLMDKRSRVATDAPSADIQKALQDQKEVLSKILGPKQVTIEPHQEATPAGDGALSSQLADSFQKPAHADDIPSSEQIRQRLLGKLKALPSLTTGEGQASVYVMYDPLCSHCKRLYKESEELAATHGIQFNWIPMFLNESSWAMSAAVLKELKQDRETATSLFGQMMTGKWSGPVAESTVRALTEEDYAAVKPATGIFIELAKSNSRIGTPLVVFENATGGIDVISGMPTQDDWSSLPPKS